MDIAKRNRLIKKTLEAAFGRGNVTVKGSRGTAYGWVRVRIYAAVKGERFSDQYAYVMKLIRGSGAELYTYDSADYGSGSCINISIEEPKAA